MIPNDFNTQEVEEMSENQEKVQGVKLSASKWEELLKDVADGWETASAVIWRPAAGEVLQGVYDGSEPFVEGTLDNEVKKHYITDENGVKYSFVGGQVFDKTIENAEIQEGYLIRVTFLGQADCKAGRVNLFDVKFKKV